ncbi:MAG: signal peptidase II [Acidimicrobiales bacterium]
MDNAGGRWLRRGEGSYLSDPDADQARYEQSPGLSEVAEPVPPIDRPGWFRRSRLVVATAAAVLVVDQLTKIWAMAALADGPVDIVGSVRLALIRNTAGAFGLGGAFVPFLAVGALVLVLVLVTRVDVTGQPAVAVAAGLVLGGAFGNLVDRLVRSPGLLRGAVVDFVDLRWWPVFNVADAAITCGCLLLLWSGWRTEGPPAVPKPERQ